MKIRHIRQCSSPFASLVVLVKKKDRTIQTCIDFKVLNGEVDDQPKEPRIILQAKHLSHKRDQAKIVCSITIREVYIIAQMMIGDTILEVQLQ